MPVAVRHPWGAGNTARAVPIMLRGCVAKEFAGFATNADRPVAHYLRALARDLNEKTPGKGVGVIGQCFTGGFALAAAVDDSVLAPVLSQPSVPLPLTPKQRRDPGLSEAELQIVEQRAANEGLCAHGTAVQRGPVAPGERFKTLKDRLGDAFEVIEIDSKTGQRARLRPDGTLGADARGPRAGRAPAYEARKRVVEFLKERLTCSAGRYPGASASAFVLVCAATRRPSRATRLRLRLASRRRRVDPSARPCRPPGRR